MNRKMSRSFAAVCSFAALLLIFLPTLVSAQGTVHVQRNPQEYWEDHHDTSMSLLDMIRFYPQPNPPMQFWARPELPIPPRAYPAKVTDPVLQRANVLGPLSASIGLNFEGNDFDTVCNCAPPDTNGAVGTTQYVQIVNTVFTVFDKSTGTVVSGPVATNTLWSGFGGSCQTANDGDGTVAFDKLANRWVFQQFVVRTIPYMECIAVSQTSDATGKYNRYAFSFGNTNFPDYPKLSVWADAYYVSFNIFANGQFFTGPDACAYDRSNMLTGATARPMQCFQQANSLNPLLPSDIDGTTAPPAGEPNFFMTFGTSGVLKLFKYHVDFATPSNSTFTGPTNISVAAFTQAPSLVSQPSPGETLDTLSDRPMYRLFYRNFGSHESIGFNHSVGNPSGIRWYEIQNPNGTPTVAQQGTFSPDSSNRWMGSTAMDSAGDQAIGYSVVSTSLDPTVRIAGRTPGDPSGTMESEINVVTGTGVQENTAHRWGDYSAMQVDPVDDCTFWYTQEYIKTTGSFDWATRIANFKFSNCGGGGGNPAVTLSTTKLNFGKVVLGQTSKSKSVTLTNSGTGTLNISNIGATGDFAITNNTCGSQVGAGASCTVTLTFSPTASGTRKGTLSFTDNAPGSPQTVALTGVGVQISLSPTSLAFGSVPVGTTSPSQNITITNVGSTTVTFTSFGFSGTAAGDYLITNNTCGATIAGGANCTVSIAFKPTVAGKRSAKFVVKDNGGGGSQSAKLTGTGV